MTVIGVLVGFGLGFVQRRSSDSDVALEMIRDELRVCGASARMRRLPCEVLVDVGQGGDVTTVRSRVLLPVGQWSMEDQDENDSRLVPDSLTGTPLPGRFGLARRPDENDDLLRVSVRDSVETIFNLSAVSYTHLTLPTIYSV